jgi:hypothetical protein
MKKYTGWVLSALFFHAGDLVNTISHFKVKGKFFFDGDTWRRAIGYRLAVIYQKLMLWSSEVQDWGGKGVWEDVVNG